MTCFKPLIGYRSKKLSDNGKRKIVFNTRDGYIDRPVNLPCGRCIGCRLAHSKEWAIRCSHEASLYKNNSFITLTYNDANLPANSSLHLPHFQLFLKKLRKKYEPKTIRYYHCGEYGEKFRRPHYHACLFNHDWPDKRLFKQLKSGPLYTSQILTDLWGKGHASCGAVTYQSAAYVARYVMKKINGPKKDDVEDWIDEETGEIYSMTHYQTIDENNNIVDIKPEYTTMSLKPGIGSGWLDRFINDVYPDDFVVLPGGKKSKVPKSYDRFYEIEHPSDYRRLRFKRLARAREKASDSTNSRLRVREQVQAARLKHLPRKLEE